MFLLNLRTIYFNFTYGASKISVFALMGVRESCAFFRSSRLSNSQNMAYKFCNPILFETNATTQLGS